MLHKATLRFVFTSFSYDNSKLGNFNMLYLIISLMLNTICIPPILMLFWVKNFKFAAVVKRTIVLFFSCSFINLPL